MQKKYFFIVIAFIVIIYTIFASISQSQKKTASSTIPSVKTSTFIAETKNETVDFSGFIKSIYETQVSPSIAGYITQLTKEEGDSVSKGEILAVIDNKELTAYEKNAFTSLQSIEKVLKETKKYYDQKVNEAKSALNNASPEEKISAEEALQSAERFRDAQIANIKAQKTSIEGTLSLSGASASHTLIRAPFSGSITSKNMTIGSYVSPGMNIYSLASGKGFEVIVSVPRSIAQNIIKGSEVILKDETTTYEGFVFSRASSTEANITQEVIRVHFTPQSDVKRLYLGKYVEASFVLEKKYEAFTIPTSAIITEYDDTFVYTIVDNQIIKKSVVLGKNNGKETEIIAGIDTNDHIITEGIHTLVPHQKVNEIYDQK